MPDWRIEALTSPRTNLSPFTKGCRDRGALMRFLNFLRHFVCQQKSPIKGYPHPSKKIKRKLNPKPWYPCGRGNSIINDALRMVCCLLVENYSNSHQVDPGGCSCNFFTSLGSTLSIFLHPPYLVEMEQNPKTCSARK